MAEQMNLFGGNPKRRILDVYPADDGSSVVIIFDKSVRFFFERGSSGEPVEPKNSREAVGFHRLREGLWVEKPWYTKILRTAAEAMSDHRQRHVKRTNQVGVSES